LFDVNIGLNVILFDNGVVLMSVVSKSQIHFDGSAGLDSSILTSQPIHHHMKL